MPNWIGGTKNCEPTMDHQSLPFLNQSQKMTKHLLQTWISTVIKETNAAIWTRAGTRRRFWKCTTSLLDWCCLGCLRKVFLTSVIALAAYNLHGTVSLLYCWDIPNKYSSFVRSHHRPIADESSSCSGSGSDGGILFFDNRRDPRRPIFKKIHENRFLIKNETNQKRLKKMLRCFPALVQKRQGLVVHIVGSQIFGTTYSVLH